MKLSISRLAALTGKTRETIRNRLEGLLFEGGPKGAQLYDSRLALPRIWQVKPPVEAIAVIHAEGFENVRRILEGKKGSYDVLTKCIERELKSLELSWQEILNLYGSGQD